MEEKILFRDLETQRLILKSISRDDRDFIFSQFSDNVVTQYLFDNEPLMDINGADDIINSYIQPEPRSQHRWIMVRKDDGTKIGTCGFHCWDEGKSSVEVGYDLKEAFWGNGYMQEALEKIIAFAVKSMNIKRIDAVVFVENPKSISVVERLGFSFDGKTKNEVFRGSEYLHHIYSISPAK